MHILINHQPYYRCNKKSFGGNKYVKQKQLQWYGQQQQQKQFSEQQPEQQPEQFSEQLQKQQPEQFQQLWQKQFLIVKTGRHKAKRGYSSAGIKVSRERNTLFVIVPCEQQ